MDRRRVLPVLRWTRNALLVWVAVLLVSIAAGVHPYVAHGMAHGQGPVEAFRLQVLPAVVYHGFLSGDLAALAVTAVAILAVEWMRRSTPPDDGGGNEGGDEQPGGGSGRD